MKIPNYTKTFTAAAVCLETVPRCVILKHRIKHIYNEWVNCYFTLYLNYFKIKFLQRFYSSQTYLKLDCSYRKKASESFIHLRSFKPDQTQLFSAAKNNLLVVLVFVYFKKIHIERKW